MDEQFHHYSQLVFIATDQEELEHYRSRTGQIADYCSQWGMQFEERIGSDAYIQMFGQAIQ